MIEEAEKLLGFEFFDYQKDCFELADRLISESGMPRLCLYYKTGAGKSITALMCMKLWNQLDVLVIAPPSTHTHWVNQGQKLGIQVEAISHARFRLKNTKLTKTRAVIADEMHLFGGHQGLGWRKLDRLAAGLQAPLVLASATPNYNDPERVYCVQHILDPVSCRGGYLEFLYKHCETEQNPFGVTPNVIRLKNFANAGEFLASLDRVAYLPDDTVYTIQEIPVSMPMPEAMKTYGLNKRRNRIMASQIEARHAEIDVAMIDEDGELRPEFFTLVEQFADEPLLVFAEHASVAEALGRVLSNGKFSYRVVTGKTSAKLKDAAIQDFKDGKCQILVGTATLATGTDGLDKVCDTLLILDDTQDDALRRQLIGRILPRGADMDASQKKIHRVQLTVT